jgi:hypothetical protein
MQITLDTRNVDIAGSVQSRNFSLQLGGHLMSVLSGLYSQKEWAIVREYGTNMLDGYLALPDGDTRPAPIITVPTPMHPYIEFKDFGIGMPFDLVWDTFTTYGASTKRDSNDQVGGLGLGSKTAFCYEHADQWTIESRYNGERHLFSATKDSNGVPMLVHMTTVPTDEPSGVTIRIPVRSYDFVDFYKAVQRLCRYYPRDLTVVGLPEGWSAERKQYQYSGEGWAASLTQSGRGNLTVVMGNVPYVITDLMTVGLDYYATHGLDLRLTVPIGAVDIVPSREALKMTDRTKQVIKAGYQQFVSHMQTIVADAIATAPTEWEALCQMNKFNVANPFQKILADVQWNGKQLNLFNGLTVAVAEIQAEHPDVQIHFVSRPTRRAKYRRSQTFLGEITLEPSKHIQLMVDDLPGRGIMTRLEHNSEDSRFWIFKNISAEALSTLFRGAPVRLASELAAPPAYVREKTGKRSLPPLRVLTHARRGRQNTLQWGWNIWGGAAPMGDVYYVPVQGVDNKSPVGDPYRLSRLVSIGQQAGVLPQGTVLYGVPVSQIKKLPEHYISLPERLREAAMEARFAVERARQTSQAYTKALESDPRNERLRDIIKKLPKQSLSPTLQAVLNAEAEHAKACEVRVGFDDLSLYLQIPMRELPTEALELRFKQIFRAARNSHQMLNLLLDFHPHTISKGTIRRLSASLAA